MSGATSGGAFLVVKSTINTPADLKGKKIGIAGFRSAMDILLKRWLKLKGIDPKDMTFIEAQFPQLLPRCLATPSQTISAFYSL